MWVSVCVCVCVSVFIYTAHNATELSLGVIKSLLCDPLRQHGGLTQLNTSMLPPPNYRARSQKIVCVAQSLINLFLLCAFNRIRDSLLWVRLVGRGWICVMKGSILVTEAWQYGRSEEETEDRSKGNWCQCMSRRSSLQMWTCYRKHTCVCVCALRHIHTHKNVQTPRSSLHLKKKIPMQGYSQRDKCCLLFSLSFDDPS